MGSTDSWEEWGIRAILNQREGAGAETSKEKGSKSQKYEKSRYLISEINGPHRSNEGAQRVILTDSATSLPVSHPSSHYNISIHGESSAAGEFLHLNSFHAVVGSGMSKSLSESSGP